MPAAPALAQHCSRAAQATTAGRPPSCHHHRSCRPRLAPLRPQQGAILRLLVRAAGLVVLLEARHSLLAGGRVLRQQTVGSHVSCGLSAAAGLDWNPSRASDQCRAQRLARAPHLCCEGAARGLRGALPASSIVCLGCVLRPAPCLHMGAGLSRLDWACWVGGSSRPATRPFLAQCQWQSVGCAGYLAHAQARPDAVPLQELSLRLQVCCFEPVARMSCAMPNKGASGRQTHSSLAGSAVGRLWVSHSLSCGHEYDGLVTFSYTASLPAVQLVRFMLPSSGWWG